MSTRVLVAIPLAAVGLYFTGVLASHGNPWFFAVTVALVKLLAFAGCMAAAVRYSRRDYLFWAWLLLSLNYGTLAASDVLLGRRINLLNINDAHLKDVLRTWIIVTSNIAASVSAVMMARTWRVAGLGQPPTRGQKLILALGIIIAVVVVGWVTWPDLKAFVSGSGTGSLIVIAASLGDLICFCVIAPLFLQTMAMRGGTLAWPWALIVASDIAWMIFDVTINLEIFSDTTTRIVAESWRCLACACALSAGLAQRWAIRSRRPW